MDIGDIKAAVTAAIPDCELSVEGEGCNFTLVVVSESFAGLLPVKRQQKVLAPLNQWLATGELHAVSMRTYTQAELEQSRAANPSGLVQLG
jgi:acid stress-induced BolA-like protein IbaG/YrbA